MANGKWDDDNPSPWGSGSSGGPKKQPPQNNQPDLDELLKKSQDKLKDMFSGGGNPKGFVLLALGAAALWLATGIYMVDKDEQGVVLRFGEYHRSTSPGLRYHLPVPFENVIKPKVTRVNKVEIGYRSATQQYGETRKAPSLEEESLMLTGDENIIDINFEVQWVIKDAKDFLFNIRFPDDTVKQAAESAMREVIGRTPITTTQTEGRVTIESEALELLQNILDSYKTGIQVVRLQMLKADPPAEVIDAFRDVQTAKADQERLRNEAEVYSNDIIPRARGEAEQILQDAQAYKQQVVARAQGEAARFSSVYEEYRKAQDVTKKRIYLETMEDIMRGMNKIIIDSKGGVVPYLPLSELSKKAEEKKQ